MPSPLCYLCGDSLGIRRAANSAKLATNRSRHVDCYKAAPAQARNSAVQEMLRACAESSYPGADDEMEIRMAEIWTTAFLRFLGPQRLTGLTSLPPELRIRIGRLLRYDSFARAVTLEYNLAKAATILRHDPSPLRDEDLSLRMDMTIRIHRLQIDGRQYIVGLNEQAQGSSELDNSDTITLESKLDWTHLVLAIDVTGCRKLFLYPLEVGVNSAQVWYRVFPRSRIATPSRFVCCYRGRTLRDVLDPDQPHNPLFDSVPPFLHLRWFAESSHTHTRMSRYSPQRIMQRRAGQQITAITVAFFDGAGVDLHFHRGSVAETKAFCQSLKRFRSAVILRYAELRPAERLVNVGVRVRRIKLGCSSACLLFRTSEGRIIDLAPYVPQRMLADYDLYSLLEQSGPIEAVYLNKRLDNSTSATIAVHRDSLQVQGQGLAVQDWLSTTTASEEEPPCYLQKPHSVFRDAIVLAETVDVWEETNEHGNRVCKGIRAPGQVLGSWGIWGVTEGGMQARGTWSSQQNLHGSYLVNVQLGSRWEVCLVREQEEMMMDGERFLLREGCSIVWWTSEDGNVVQVC